MPNKQWVLEYSRGHSFPFSHQVKSSKCEDKLSYFIALNRLGPTESEIPLSFRTSVSTVMPLMPAMEKAEWTSGPCDSKFGLFGRGQGPSARNLSMSVFHILLGQFGIMRNTRTLSSSIMHSSWGRTIIGWKAQTRFNWVQEITRDSTAKARGSLVLATNLFNLLLNLEARMSPPLTGYKRFLCGNHCPGSRHGQLKKSTCPWSDRVPSVGFYYLFFTTIIYTPR